MASFQLIKSSIMAAICVHCCALPQSIGISTLNGPGLTKFSLWYHFYFLKKPSFMRHKAYLQLSRAASYEQQTLMLVIDLFVYLIGSYIVATGAI